MKYIRTYQVFEEAYNNSVNEMRQTPTFDNLIRVLTELLKTYDDAEVSRQQCTYVSGMIRWIFERYSIKSKLMSAIVTDNTPKRAASLPGIIPLSPPLWSDSQDEFHHFVVSNGKSIDFTMSQFFHKDIPFPLILDVDSDAFMKIYKEVQDDEKGYLYDIKSIYDDKELYWDEDNKEYTNDDAENEMYSYIDKIIEIFG